MSKRIIQSGRISLSNCPRPIYVSRSGIRLKFRFFLWFLLTPTLNSANARCVKGNTTENENVMKIKPNINAG